MFKNTGEKLCSKRLMKKYVIKDYLYITIAFVFCWFLIVAKKSQSNELFVFFPNLIYLPGRRNGCNIQGKRQKIVNLHKSGGFSVIFKDKECNYCMYMRVGIEGSWFMNYKSTSWSHNLKIHKTSIFRELLFKIW